jgi:hypothetical protein
MIENHSIGWHDSGKNVYFLEQQRQKDKWGQQGWQHLTQCEWRHLEGVSILRHNFKIVILAHKSFGNLAKLNFPNKMLI